MRAYASPSNRQPAVMVKDTEATEDTLESNASQSSDQTPTNVPKSPDGKSHSHSLGQSVFFQEIL